MYIAKEILPDFGLEHRKLPDEGRKSKPLIKTRSGSHLDEQHSGQSVHIYKIYVPLMKLLHFSWFHITKNNLIKAFSFSVIIFYCRHWPILLCSLSGEANKKRHIRKLKLPSPQKPNCKINMYI